MRRLLECCAERGESLAGIDLQGANLREADLRGANLYRANLREAHLYRANLREANLYKANLRGAYLYGADLRGAHLREADLREADLREADLREANLYGANLREADLREANLYGANLYGADLYGADLPPFKICPEKGSFTAWKKTTKGVIEILIPEDAQRINALGSRKCRASKVVVIDGPGVNGVSPNQTVGVIQYAKGATIEAPGFNDDVRVECAEGIHFFMTKQEAEEWR